MSLTSGTVNEHLLPMVPVSIRKGIDQWQQANVVLDTGFNGDIALEAKLLVLQRRFVEKAHCCYLS